MINTYKLKSPCITFYPKYLNIVAQDQYLSLCLPYRSLCYCHMKSALRDTDMEITDSIAVITIICQNDDLIEIEIPREGHTIFKCLQCAIGDQHFTR